MENQTTDFEQIYINHYDSCYKAAFRITGSHHDAEDVLQDAYMNAMAAFESFEGRSAVSTWLYRITVNSAIKYVKYRKSFPVERLSAEKNMTVGSFFESLKDCRHVEDEVLYNDMRETCIHMFIECLPLKQRLTFILRMVMDLSVSEVAQILDVSESAVKTNLHRARNSLLKAMDGKCSFIDPKFPCKCKLWVNYAIENNKRGLIKPMLAEDRDEEELYRQILAEMNYLRKLAILYKSDYRHGSGKAFVDKMKNALTKKELKIFR